MVWWSNVGSPASRLRARFVFVSVRFVSFRFVRFVSFRLRFRFASFRFGLFYLCHLKPDVLPMQVQCEDAIT